MCRKCLDSCGKRLDLCGSGFNSCGRRLDLCESVLILCRKPLNLCESASNTCDRHLNLCESRLNSCGKRLDLSESSSNSCRNLHRSFGQPYGYNSRQNEQQKINPPISHCARCWVDFSLYPTVAVPQRICCKSRSVSPLRLFFYNMSFYLYNTL